MDFRDVLVVLTGYLSILTTDIECIGIQNIYASGCSNETIELKCPEYHKIAIKRLFYGVKRDRRCATGGRRYSMDCCRRSSDDCLLNNDSKYPSLNLRCSGRDKCKRQTHSIRTAGACENPDWKRTDYKTIIYDCVPDADVVHFCSNEQRHGKILYLSNENYPYAIRGGKHDCKCVMSTKFSRGINIHAIDVLFTRSAYGNHICGQHVQVTDHFGYNRQITCGNEGLYGFRAVYNRGVSNVTLNLKSESEESRSYIWLQVTADDPDDYAVISCGSSIGSLYPKPSPYPDDEDSGDTHVNKTGAATADVYGAGPELTTDIVAIIAGVGVAVGLVILTALIAIIVHCVRSNRRSAGRKRSLESHPSPITRSKTLPLQSSSYCKYDYDEDQYCSIRRSPMKVSKLTEVDLLADQKLKEAFLKGASNENSFKPSSNYPTSPTPLLPPADFSGDGDHDYVDVGTPPQTKLKPGKTEMARIQVSTLPNKNGRNKNKTVTFSPVAMVSPLHSGSEESMTGQEYPDKAMTIAGYGHHAPTYTNLLPDSDKTKRVVIIQGTASDRPQVFTFPQPPSEDELWKSVDNTVFEDGTCDNIQYYVNPTKPPNSYHDLKRYPERKPNMANGQPSETGV